MPLFQILRLRSVSATRRSLVTHALTPTTITSQTKDLLTGRYLHAPLFVMFRLVNMSLFEITI